MTTSNDFPPLPIPDPDDIRDAIDAHAERARLLRRLLRLAMRLRLPLTTAVRISSMTTSTRQGERSNNAR